MKDNNNNKNSLYYLNINSEEEGLIEELIFENDVFKKFKLENDVFKKSNLKKDKNAFYEKFLSENPDLKELYLKKFKETIDVISDIHGEASYLIAITQIFETENIKEKITISMSMNYQKTF